MIRKTSLALIYLRKIKSGDAGVAVKERREKKRHIKTIGHRIKKSTDEANLKKILHGGSICSHKLQIERYSYKKMEKMGWKPFPQIPADGCVEAQLLSLISIFSLSSLSFSPLTVKVNFSIIFGC